jgi:hypothetical protein
MASIFRYIPLNKEEKIKMSSKHLLAISGLAIGIATGISATPASAVSITPGSVLAFNDGAANTAGTISPTTVGNSFTGTFNGNNAAIVSSATTGTFSTLLSPFGAKTVNTTSSIFSRVGLSTTVPGGIDYSNSAPLTFNFGTAGTLTVPTGAFFLADTSPTPGNTTFRIYTSATAPGAPNFFGTFLNGTDSSTVQFNDFRFEVTTVGSPIATGSYSLTATAVPTAAVPEPFTIIGTLVGGSAALRMRKRLMSSLNK